MSEPTRLPPLSPQIEELLGESRDVGMPDDVSARMTARLDALFDAPPPTEPGDEGGSPEGGSPPPAEASADPTAGSATAGAETAGAGASAASAAAGATGFLGAKLFGASVPALVTTLALGMAAGAGLHAALAPPVVVERVVTVPAPSAPETAEHQEHEAAPSKQQRDAAPAAPVEEVAEPSPASTTRTKTPELSRDEQLRLEQTVIERARTALHRGSPSESLVVLADHARRFPSGTLAQEREALAVQALVASGQYRRARQRAQRFQRRYPRSLFSRAIAHSLASIPSPASDVPDGGAGSDGAI